MQFGFLPGYGSTNAIFNLGEFSGNISQRKNLQFGLVKNLKFGLVDLDKAFDFGLPE